MKYGSLTIMQAFELVDEAATLGAGEGVGPSDISVRDYADKVQEALEIVRRALQYPDMVLRHGDGTPYMNVDDYSTGSEREG